MESLRPIDATMVLPMRLRLDEINEQISQVQRLGGMTADLLVSKALNGATYSERVLLAGLIPEILKAIRSSKS